MDTGRGEFAEITPEIAMQLKQLSETVKDAPSVFFVGEEVTIKNSRFRVVALGDQFMKLKLLPKWQQSAHQ